MSAPSYRPISKSGIEWAGACSVCGALVPRSQQGTHDAWHMAHRDVTSILVAALVETDESARETAARALDELRQEL